jgi:hypothetical protein
MNIIRAERADLQLGSKTIDCYMFPSGEKRIGITGASLAIGKAKNYLSRLQDSQSNNLKTLQGNGYTGYLREASIKNERGGTRSKTISISDFTKLIAWDAIENKNTNSIALLATFAEIGLEKLIDGVFKGFKTDLTERIAHYTQWTNSDLQQALLINYDDWNLIEEQELFLQSV